MTLFDWLKIVGGLVGLVVGCFVIPILAVMRFEARRQARAVARLAAGLDAAVSSDARGPGAWKLTALEGRRAGCTVTLRPKALAQSISVGNSRMKSMGVQLTVRGSRDIGTGSIEVRDGALVMTGQVTLDDVVRLALIRCEASLACAGTEVHAEYALPISNAHVDEMLSLIDAIGPALT